MEVLMKHPSIIEKKFTMIDGNEIVARGYIMSYESDFSWTMIRSITGDSDKYKSEVASKIAEEIKTSTKNGVFAVCRKNEMEVFKSAGFIPWREIQNKSRVQAPLLEILVYKEDANRAWHLPRNKGINDLDKVFGMVEY